MFTTKTTTVLKLAISAKRNPCELLSPKGPERHAN